MAPIDWEPLFLVARTARARAHAPYSHFQVGAAVLLDDGSTVCGCNVENASYGLTVCAERNALGAMVVLGSRRPVAVAIAVDSQTPTPPCGACRQVLAEFGDASLPIVSRTLTQEARWTLGELLPAAFTRSFF